MSIDSIFKIKNFASSLWGGKKKSSHFYEGPVVSFKVLRQAMEIMCHHMTHRQFVNQLGEKLNQTILCILKTKFWKRVTKWKIWPFRKQHNTKQNHLSSKPWEMSENKLKQADCQHGCTESEEEHQKERNVFFLFFFLPLAVYWGGWPIWIVIVVNV